MDESTTPENPNTSDQPSVAREVASVSQMLCPVHEKLKACIAMIDGAQHPKVMHAQQTLQLRDKREQLRSAAAKMKRAQELLALVSTGDVDLTVDR